MVWRKEFFKINKYIEKQKELGKKVYVLDAEAAIYMIPFNRYNKIMICLQKAISEKLVNKEL